MSRYLKVLITTPFAVGIYALLESAVANHPDGFNLIMPAYAENGSRDEIGGGHGAGEHGRKGAHDRGSESYIISERGHQGPSMYGGGSKTLESTVFGSGYGHGSRSDIDHMGGDSSKDRPQFRGNSGKDNPGYKGGDKEGDERGHPSGDSPEHDAAQ